MSLRSVALLPYKIGSQSATNLQAALSTLTKKAVRRLYIEGGSYVPRADKLVINWGSSSLPGGWQVSPIVWNKTPNVGNASNKLTAFNLFKEAGITEIPEFTTDYAVASEWVTAGKVVLSRTKLSAHSGAGIVMAARVEDLVQNCPLYVLYRKKKTEFRVHVAFGSVIDVQQKRKRADYDGDTDYAVRNHHTGWVYCRDGVEECSRRDDLAIRAVAALGLDFGAVDIIYNEHHNSYLLLEVNTAPGLEGTTVEKYAHAFYAKIQEHV